MRRNLLIFICLLAVGGFYSCLYKEAIEDPVPEAVEPEIPSEGAFSILSAKQFFDSNIPGFRLVDLEGGGVAEEDAVTRSIIDARVLTPKWADGQRYTHDSMLIVDVPISTQERVWARRRYVNEQGRMTTQKTLALSKLVFVVDPVKSDTVVLVATLVPEYAYTRAKLYKVSAVRSIPTNENFTGRVFYSTIYGDFIGGEVFKDGAPAGHIMKNPLYGQHQEQTLCDDPTHDHANGSEHDHKHAIGRSLPDDYEAIHIVIAEDAIFTRTRSGNDSCDDEYDVLTYCNECKKDHYPPLCLPSATVTYCRECPYRADECKCCTWCKKYQTHAPNCPLNQSNFCPDCLRPMAQCACSEGPPQSHTCRDCGMQACSQLCLCGCKDGPTDPDDDDDETNSNNPNNPSNPGTETPSGSYTTFDYKSIKIRVRDVRNYQKIVNLLNSLEQDCMGGYLASNTSVTITDDLPSTPAAAASYNPSKNTIQIRSFNDFYVYEELLHAQQFQKEQPTGGSGPVATKEVEAKVGVLEYMKNSQKSDGTDRTGELPLWNHADKPWDKIGTLTGGNISGTSVVNGVSKKNYEHALDGVSDLGYQREVSAYLSYREDDYSEYENLDLIEEIRQKAGC